MIKNDNYMPVFLRNPLMILLALEAVAIVLCAHELMRLPDGHMHVAFLDVGQGDSTLVTTPSGKRIIVDGGPDMSLLHHLGERLPLFDRRIDLLIMSHPQLDHMAAFPEVLRRYQVGHVLMTGVNYKLAQYREFLDLMKEQHIPLWLADPSQDIDFGDGTVIDVAWPRPGLFGKDFGDDVNNSSVVVRIMEGSGAVLFTGDMEEKEERAVLASGADIAATVLKVGHHGSKTSSGTGFLLAVHPSLASISCAKVNHYGHPSKSVIERFRMLGIPTHVTGWEGTVEAGW